MADGVRFAYRLRVPRRSNADAIVATAWQTAEALGEAGVQVPRGFYLIQHHEVWGGEEERVNDTWRLPLTRIVISGWLADVAEQLDALPVHQIPNGIDMDVFSVRVPPERRAPATVAMMWHGSEWKGSAIGLAALTQVQARVPELRAHLFSVYPRPSDLPDWVTWHAGPRGAALSELLNSCAVFVSPSITEGWPLPPAEALASGCCLVSTDIPGVADYAEQGVTALLVPPGDADSMADAVERVIRDHELRHALATAGHARIAEHFSWDRAVDRLEGLLVSVAGDNAAAGG
jgi:glycosyltransferase involved in cell wall biosynthesis